MRIGILTFHRPVNYGAFLQAFSLSNNISRKYPNAKVEIIDYIAPKEKKKIYLNVLRTFKYNGIDVMIKELKKINIFKKSLEILPLSANYFCDEQLENLFSYIDNNYDLLIIGSDAVFNWNQNGYPSAFLPLYKFKIPVVSYAASVHGLKYYEVDKKIINEVGSVFSNMALVGVRDKNTENFVSFCNPNKKLIHCCDPTVVMNFDQLYSFKHRSLQEIKKNYKLDMDKEYIVLMLEEETISKEIYEKYSQDYTIISLFKKNKSSDIFMYDLNPIEWALVIKNARLVFTNFFHGTLLSLTQGVPVIVIDVSGYDKPYEGKLNDLMVRRFDLPKLYIKKEQWDDKKNIIYTVVDDCLDGKYKGKIQEVVNKEADAFDDFINEINKLIKKNI